MVTVVEWNHSDHLQRGRHYQMTSHSLVVGRGHPQVAKVVKVKVRVVKVRMVK